MATRTELNLPSMPNISRTYDTEVKLGVSGQDTKRVR